MDLESTDRATMHESIQSLATNIQPILSTVTNIQAEIQGLRSEMLEIRGEIRDLSSRTQNLESSKKVHDDAIANLQKEVKDLRLSAN
jgi:chromosome segregation ATPase